MGEKPTGAIRKKRDQKKQRKDPYSWDNALKELETTSESDKGNVIEKKYRDLHDAYFLLLEQLKACQNEYNNLDNEKNHLSRELTKAEISRVRLEELARGLQKQNKEIKVRYNISI